MTMIDTLIDVHYGTHTGMRTGTTNITDATDIMRMRVELSTGSVMVKRGLITGLFSGNWQAWYWTATLKRGC